MDAYFAEGIEIPVSAPGKLDTDAVAAVLKEKKIEFSSINQAGG